MKQLVCASCGENTFQDDCESVHLKDVDLDLFRLQNESLPISSPFPNGVLKDLILHPRGVNVIPPEENISFFFCHSCWNSLRRHRLPYLSLANDTFLGDVPPELQDLTFVEELMIGLCRAKCSIFQLSESKRQGSSAVSQTAFRGHIIIYPQNPSSTASTLPPLIEEVTSLICILFIGSTKPTLKWLHEKAKPLAVRANNVRNALQWLKRNNRLYENVFLNEDVLSSLPEDGILPFHIEHMSSSVNQDSLTSTYDNLRNVSNDLAHTDTNSIAFEKILITDVEGHTTPNELRIAALNHIQKKQGAFLTIPHGRDPESEFANPCLFPKMYPTLFPYGVGGFEDESRRYKISFKAHVKHLLKWHNNQFQQHHSFPFVAFNILQRRSVLLRTHLRMKRSKFAATAQMYEMITPETIRRMIDRSHKDDIDIVYDDDDRRILRLMQDIRVITSQVPGSSSSHLQMRNKI